MQFNNPTKMLRQIRQRDKTLQIVYQLFKRPLHKECTKYSKNFQRCLAVSEETPKNTKNRKVSS